MRRAQHRVSTVPRYVKLKALDQLEEWMKEKPIPYLSNDKFSQEGIFQYWAGRLPGHAHVNQTYPDVVRMWRQFHGCPASGGGIERVFFAAGKQHDALKKKIIDKTLTYHHPAGSASSRFQLRRYRKQEY
jgi:hypothetical protein